MFVHVTFLAKFFLTDFTLIRFLTAVEHDVYFYIRRFIEYFSATYGEAFVLGIEFKCFVVVLAGNSVKRSWYANESCVLIAYVPVQFLLIDNLVVLFVFRIFVIQLAGGHMPPWHFESPERPPWSKGSLGSKLTKLEKYF